ncbi:hypothetical protein EMIT0111MI5_11118 [Burkholderia sp. IT-111MI5]
MYIQLCLFKGVASNPCLSLIVGSLGSPVEIFLKFQLTMDYTTLNPGFLDA